MQSYKDLEVYQLSHKMAVEVHQMSLSLPKFELHEEGSQIRRSSKAISVNIVEGFGRRRYKADYVRFLIYAHASCDETREHLMYLFETKSLKNADIYAEILEGCDMVSRKINKFIQAVDN